MTKEINLPVLTKPGRKIQIDFFGKLHIRLVTSEPCILIGFDWCSKWPYFGYANQPKRDKSLNFQKISSTCTESRREKNRIQGTHSYPKFIGSFPKNKNIEIEYSPTGLHTGIGAVERVMKKLKKLIIANLEDKIGFTKSVGRALRVMRFTVHTGLKVSPFETQDGRRPSTDKPTWSKIIRVTFPTGKQLAFLYHRNKSPFT